MNVIEIYCFVLFIEKEDRLSYDLSPSKENPTKPFLSVCNRMYYLALTLIM